MSEIEQAAVPQDQGVEAGGSTDPAREALRAALVTVAAPIGDGEDVVVAATRAIGAASESLAELDKRIAELETANGELIAEKAVLAGKLAAVDKTPRAKVGKGGKPRKLGPVAGEPIQAAALHELVRAAGKVEVAFGDGRRELAQVPPREITGEAWQVTVSGLRLRLDVTIDGRAMPEAGLAGYGLFLDGELVAYRARGEVLPIGGGRLVSLAGDIVF